MGTHRPEIQALRALAVALVVVYHLWPTALPGGFIGVDVFFVISGFLITALLLREIEHTGTVSLSRFWARRARRILPAALFTLLCSLVATLALVPINLWPQLLSELLASTAYVQNWHLASQAVDYFAVAEQTDSPVKHYWSLALEEQFYLVWPVLLLLAAPTRRALTVAIAGVAAASIAYSLVRDGREPRRGVLPDPGAGVGVRRGSTAGAGRGPRTALSFAVAGLGLATITAAAIAITHADALSGLGGVRAGPRDRRRDPCTRGHAGARFAAGAVPRRHLLLRLPLALAAARARALRHRARAGPSIEDRDPVAHSAARVAVKARSRGPTTRRARPAHVDVRGRRSGHTAADRADRGRWGPRRCAAPGRRAPDARGAGRAARLLRRGGDRSRARLREPAAAPVRRADADRGAGDGHGRSAGTSSPCTASGYASSVCPRAEAICQWRSWATATRACGASCSTRPRSAELARHPHGSCELSVVARRPRHPRARRAQAAIGGAGTCSRGFARTPR